MSTAFSQANSSAESHPDATLGDYQAGEPPAFQQALGGPPHSTRLGRLSSPGAVWGDGERLCQ